MKKFLLIIISIILILALTSCGGDDSASGVKVVFTTGFSDNDVFRINDSICTKPEFMLYLTTVQNKYEEVYGSEIWSLETDDVSLKEGVKENVLANISLIKSLYLYAESLGALPDESEKELITKASEYYYKSLNETELEAMGVEYSDIERAYTEYFCATKVYEIIVSDINPEISDDEARCVEVAPIFFKTYTNNGAGDRVEYSSAMRKNVLDRAQKVMELIDKGEDFTILQSVYSEDKAQSISFMRGEVDLALEKVAFNLGKDEVSNIIETRDGLYIIKCISTHNDLQTSLNKEIILSNARSDAFDEKYNSFSESLVKQINKSVYDDITLITDEKVKSKDFFEVYKKFIS